MKLGRDRPTGRPLAALALAALLAIGTAACGSDDDNAGSGGSSGKTEQVEKAFLTAMVPHHESAIDMAEVAEDKGRDRFITQLADDILTTQEREIAQMEQIYERLIGGELKPDPDAHNGLGLTAEAAGMTHTSATSDMLRSAKPFDRAFVDEMVPHHEGAIEMAGVVLKSTKDRGLRDLAERIVATQEREVERMNAFRTRKYGGPVPADAGHGSGKTEGGTGHSGSGH